MRSVVETPVVLDDCLPHHFFFSMRVPGASRMFFKALIVSPAPSLVCSIFASVSVFCSAFVRIDGIRSNRPAQAGSPHVTCTYTTATGPAPASTYQHLPAPTRHPPLPPTTRAHQPGTPPPRCDLQPSPHSAPPSHAAPGPSVSGAVCVASASHPSSDTPTRALATRSGREMPRSRRDSVKRGSEIPTNGEGRRVKGGVWPGKPKETVPLGEEGVSGLWAGRGPRDWPPKPRWRMTFARICTLPLGIPGITLLPSIAAVGLRANETTLDLVLVQESGAHGEARPYSSLPIPVAKILE